MVLPAQVRAMLDPVAAMAHNVPVGRSLASSSCRSNDGDSLISS